LFGALFASGVGVLMLLLIYGANIFAAYEVALFRAQPLALVCGVAAVLPLLGPIIFLAMPTRMTRRYATEEADAGPEPEPTTYAVPTAQPAEGTAESAGGLRLAQSQPQAGADATAPAQVFARGQYTFNRRFFETKFPGFFSMIRREAERDLVLVFKTSRGEFTVQRITRIASSDLHAEVSRGGGAEEMMISFPEIQEVQLKHKNT
jgi:hypothetical protein